jgi:excisionase family DNA binding protein
MHNRPILVLDGPSVVVSARVAARIAPALMEKLRRELRHGEEPDGEEAATVQALDTLARAVVDHRLGRSDRRSDAGTSGGVIPPASPKLGPMSAQQAALELGCGVRNVVALAKRGSLPGLKVGGVWNFDAEAVAELAQRAR